MKFTFLVIIFALFYPACWVILHAFLSSAVFFSKLTFSKLFREYMYHQIIRQFEIRSGTTFRHAWSGTNCKSYQRPPAGKELMLSLKIYELLYWRFTTCCLVLFLLNVNLDNIILTILFILWICRALNINILSTLTLILTSPGVHRNQETMRWKYKKWPTDTTINMMMSLSEGMNRWLNASGWLDD